MHFKYKSASEFYPLRIQSSGSAGDCVPIMQGDSYTYSIYALAVLSVLLAWLLTRRSGARAAVNRVLFAVVPIWTLCLLVVVAFSINAKLKGAFGTTVAQPAPDVQLVTADGQQFALRDFRGKVLLLDFWATWCPPCAKTRPVLERIQERFAGDGLRVIGISADDDEAKWRHFIAENEGPSADCRDIEHAAQKAFRIDGRLPTYVLIDRNGIERKRFVGLTPVTEAQLQREIAKLLE